MKRQDSIEIIWKRSKGHGRANKMQTNDLFSVSSAFQRDLTYFNCHWQLTFSPFFAFTFFYAEKGNFKNSVSSNTLILLINDDSSNRCGVCGITSDADIFNAFSESRIAR